MKSNSRLINLLAAGNILALLMVSFLAFGGRFTPSAMAETASSAFSTSLDQVSEAVSLNEAVPSNKAIAANDAPSFEAQLAALQGQNQELRQALRLMETREADFRQVIAEANETIQGLEQSVATTRNVYSTQNQELGNNVQELATRENEYQSRIATANETIVNLENQLTNTSGTVGTLQAQNNELVSVLQVMQTREAEYQAQIAAANQALAAMQGQGGEAYGGGEYEEHEEEGEYVEHEEEKDEDDD
ncbi:MAG: hypothetical protein AAF702_02380 [Chloroflexota bacterium]